MSGVGRYADRPLFSSCHRRAGAVRRRLIGMLARNDFERLTERDVVLLGAVPREGDDLRVIGTVLGAARNSCGLEAHERRDGLPVLVQRPDVGVEERRFHFPKLLRQRFRLVRGEAELIRFDLAPGWAARPWYGARCWWRKTAVSPPPRYWVGNPACGVRWRTAPPWT